MKKILFGIAVVAVLVAAFGTAGYVYAQAPTPEAPRDDFGSGMSGGRGGMMGGRGIGADDGVMHDQMIAAFAEKFGMTVEDLEGRLENGETMSQIASEKGVTVEDFFSLMTEVRNQAVDQAVADGTLTQEQADWMKQRGAGMGGRGRGMGQGQFQHEDCPYMEDNS